MLPPIAKGFQATLEPGEGRSCLDNVIYDYATRKVYVENLRTWANGVTLLRILVGVILFGAATYAGDPWLNLAGLGVYWSLDVLDGVLARSLGQETLFGAQMDILADRLLLAWFYLNYLMFNPHLAPVIVLFLLEFLVLDQYLSNQYLRWPIISINYFYWVDHRIWLLNWSPVAKFLNTGLVTFLLVGTNSNWVALPAVLALIAVKMYSCARMHKLPIPEIWHTPALGQGGQPSASTSPM